MKRNISISLFILFATISLVFIFSRATSKNQSKEVEIWPAIQPYDTGYLPVSELHTIYYEQSGNPKGEPVFVVHGGPGGGTTPTMRRFLNPKKFRIILFDQRGAGKSKPFAEIEENQLLRNAGRIKDIPCTIVNGRYDMCCPLVTAYKLHQALPRSKLVIVEDGGHGGWPVIKTTIREMRAFE